ncbi:MAG TPA: hypothetical protein VHR47_11610 [Bacillota bacterium]|nr:hypothetical protein [Bacillota bacterium]
MALSFVIGALYDILASDDSVFTGRVNVVDQTDINAPVTAVTMQLTEDTDPFVTGDVVTIYTNQIIAFKQYPAET